VDGDGRGGARLAHNGELWTVVAMEAGCVVLAGPGGRGKRVVTATLLADATTRVLGARKVVPAPMGSVLDDLTDAERTQLSERLGHVREVLTGYCSGSADLVGPGEPRPEYDSSLPQKGRYRAKAAELGVGSRTVERWVAAVREVDRSVFSTGGRTSADPFAGVDERWLAMCRTVLDEHTTRRARQATVGRPRRCPARRRVRPGMVSAPGPKKARASSPS